MVEVLGFILMRILINHSRHVRQNQGIDPDDKDELDIFKEFDVFVKEFGDRKSVEHVVHHMLLLYHLQKFFGML